MDVAIGIVLLPESKFMKLCVDISHELQSRGGNFQYNDYPTLGFDSKDLQNSKGIALPHITLGQTFTDENNLPDIKNILKTSLQLRASHVDLGRTSKLTHLIIEKNDDLQKLHMNVLELIKNYKNTSENSKLSNTTQDWIKSFLSKSSGQNFRPHITLGNGEYIIKSFEFTCSRIAICELGEYCTARKILKSEEI